MTLRITQLIARLITYAAVYIAAKNGLAITEAEAGPVSEAIAGAVVAAVGFAVDLYLHRKQKNTPGDEQ